MVIFVLNKILNLLDSIQWYTTQLITIIEFTHTKFIIVRKKLKLTKKILNTRKKHTKNKKIILESKFVFFIQKFFNIAHTAETKAKIKKKRKQPRKCTIDEALDEEKIEILENVSSSSDLDCIIIARHK